MTKRSEIRVYLNGVLMKQGADYRVEAPGADQPVITWLPGGIADPLDPADQISIKYEEKEEPSAVDQLADVALSPEERKRRKARRNLESLMRTGVELGLSPRGFGR